MPPTMDYAPATPELRLAWRRLLSLLGACVVVVVVIHLSASLTSFVYPRAMLITFAPAALLSLMTFGRGALAKTLIVVLAAESPPTDVQTAAKVLRASAIYVLAAGFLGSVIGLISMLQNMSDPDMLGPSMGIALISSFYGGAAAVLLFGLSLAVTRSEAAESAQLKTALPITAGAAFSGLMMLMLTFVVLLLSMSELKA